MTALLVVAIAYLLGGIPFGYLLVRWKSGSDIRSQGSGNIGATNVLRTTGRALGIATLLLDIGKGFLAMWIAGWLTDGAAWATSAAAVAVMLGHAYPVFLKFRGGKAVASVVGAFLYLAPAALGAVVVVFVATVAWTRHISMGSIISAAVLPLAVWLIMVPPVPVEAAAIVCGAFIIYRHSSNIQRLRAGTERVFTFGSRKA
jgi:acyl phosphate:glycerol-3-phosphate acyltransferase